MYVEKIGEPEDEVSYMYTVGRASNIDSNFLPCSKFAALRFRGSLIKLSLLTELAATGLG